MIKLAPSILAADFNILGEQIKKIENAGVPYLHIDVMDGNFVPSISFGMPLIASIRKNTKMVFDVHLMVEEPIRYIKEFKDAGADIITVHVEACSDVAATISAIKELGCKAGITLCPATGLEVIDPFLGEVDMVLVMSVNPGFGGQAFIPESIDRIKALKKRIDELGLTVDIEVDGGVNKRNTMDLLRAGANVIVSGTSIFRGDIDENLNLYHGYIADYEQEKGVQA